MSYSSIYNVDTSLNYEVRLNGETLRKNVKPHHVASVIYDLEAQGEVSVVDETWDDENMVVDLTATEVLDSDEDVVDEQDDSE